MHPCVISDSFLDDIAYGLLKTAVSNPYTPTQPRGVKSHIILRSPGFKPSVYSGGGWHKVLLKYMILGARNAGRF